jgi:hypothetical protein
MSVSVEYSDAAGRLYRSRHIAQVDVVAKKEATTIFRDHQEQNG